MKNAPEYKQAVEIMRSALIAMQKVGVSLEIVEEVASHVAMEAAFKSGSIERVKRVAERMVGKSYERFAENPPKEFSGRGENAIFRN